MNNIRRSVQLLRWHIFHTIPMIVGHASTYPEFPRKSSLRRYLENLYIYIRDGAPCAAYDGLGLDIKGRKLNDFVGNLFWIRFLDGILDPEGWKQATPLQRIVLRGRSQIPLLQNKFLFWSFMEQHGIPTIPMLAHITGGKLYEHPSPGTLGSVERFFVKPIGEMCGNSAFCVIVKDGKFHVDGKEVTIDDLTNGRQDSIFQPVVENHRDIKAFNPSTLNTIRIVTCREKNGEIGLWDPGMLRIGRLNACVDNFAKGGIGVGIDGEGKLERYGYSHDKKLCYVKMECHPDSHLAFKGREIPYYKDVVDLVKNAHKLFGTLQTVGWDVAVTSDGAFLLEGNHCWDIEMLQVVHGKGSASRFGEIFGKRTT